VGRRVLLTGLGTFWGGKVAQALERRDDVEVIVGMDATEPLVELERTEYVRADETYSILSRIVEATQVDTIVHTFLVVDSTQMRSKRLHEINVIGTMNLLAAAGAPDTTVRKVVVKSSGLVYGCSSKDPLWFSEETPRSEPPQTQVEDSLIAAESYLRDFAQDNPHVTVTLLRFSNVLGNDISTPFTDALSRGIAPAIFGFDPQLQFVDEDDVVAAIEFASTRDCPGIYNVAGDGLLPWSEVAKICGATILPISPVMTELAVQPLRRLGLVRLPPETLSLLRYGRGLDNRRFKDVGFRYRYSSLGAVERFAKSRRLAKAVGGTKRSYTYDRDVESFFHHSPAVVRTHSTPRR
jgi:UDP-glucose 4-epimerase